MPPFARGSSEGEYRLALVDVEAGDEAPALAHALVVDAIAPRLRIVHADVFHVVACARASSEGAPRVLPEVRNEGRPAGQPQTVGRWPLPDGGGPSDKQRGLLRNVQHQLRMIMEAMYTTTRLVFLTSNIDQLDDTVLSRLVCVRVASPTVAQTVALLRTMAESAGMDDRELEDVARATHLNLTSSRFRLLQTKLGIQDEISCLVEKVWETITTNANPLPAMREMVRNSNLIHIAWNTVMDKLIMGRIMGRSERYSPETIEGVLKAWGTFSYLYTVDTRKEHPIEMLVIALALLINHHRDHREVSALLTDDWF